MSTQRGPSDQRGEAAAIPVGPDNLWPGSDAPVTVAQKRKRQWRTAAFIPAHIMMATSGTKQTVTLNNMYGTSMLLQLHESSFLNNVSYSI